MIVNNTYIPSSVSTNPTGSVSFGTTLSGLLGITPNLSKESRVSTKTATEEFLNTYGKSNKPFLSGAAGVLMPGDRTPIQRGYIRRSVVNQSNDISTMVMRFMYNPSQIVRNYASYLDQAAIDPFNTIFQSGNLVAPPSIIEFSFSLIFDREAEATSAGPWTTAEGPDWPNVGVLHDYTFFDAVVRNVPPNGTPGAIPDNGVMMVNPEDITVVFSKDLTVQGRPTNSQVSFTKFNTLMVPTRMEIQITLIANYFGPLKQPYGQDAQQQIANYEALVPYDTALGDGLTTTVSLDTALVAYRKNKEIVANQDLTAAILIDSVTADGAAPPQWFNSSNATTADGGGAQTQQMVGPVNSAQKIPGMMAIKDRASSATAGVDSQPSATPNSSPPARGTAKPLDQPGIAREWGPGCYKGPTTTIPLYGGGKMIARVEVVDAVKALSRCLEATNYPAKASQTSSFVCRQKRPPATGISNHSFAQTIDINSLDNPQLKAGVVPTATVQAVLAVRTNSGHQVWGWGGNYTKKYLDPMHWEVVATKSAIASGINLSTVPGGHL